MTLFTGAATALVTPFKEGKVDFPSFGRLIDWQINQGIDALVICGTTGEASTLNVYEHVDSVRYAIRKLQAGCRSLPVPGSNDTHHAIEMSKALNQEGADGLLLVTTYYKSVTERACHPYLRHRQSYKHSCYPLLCTGQNRCKYHSLCCFRTMQASEYRGH